LTEKIIILPFTVSLLIIKGNWKFAAIVIIGHWKIVLDCGMGD